MIRDASVELIPEQPTISIHVETTAANTAAALAESLAQVWEYVVGNGGRPAGPPFSRSQMVGQILELEAGLPLAAALPGHGRIRAGKLPAGPVAKANHFGAYAGLADARAELLSWVKLVGREPAGPVWMLYHSDAELEPDISLCRTELFVPLKPID
jgi:effector-binding domain-containing protein